MEGTPARRPGSVRRTAHINMVWPEGFGTELQLRGSARDLFTPQLGDPLVLDEATMVAGIGDGRVITSVEVTPDQPGVKDLVGAKGGSNSRSVIDEVMSGQAGSASPLRLLLDDIAGCSLIAPFAWSQARPDPDRPNPLGPRPSHANAPPAEPIGIRKGRIICSGLRPGGYHEVQRSRGAMAGHHLRTPGQLESEDRWAWHEIEPAPEVCMRRRRRFDVWTVSGGIEVESHFRDSCWHFELGELVVHEYTLQATLDHDHNITEIIARPRVLPFPECPGAASHVEQLVGKPVRPFRSSVPETLRELEACTHLNDMLRGLADLDSLARALEPGTS